MGAPSVQAHVRANPSWMLFPHFRHMENTYKMDRHQMQKPSAMIQYGMHALAQVLAEGLVLL